MLTGKAKEDFETWVGDDFGSVRAEPMDLTITLDDLGDLFVNALIIDWLDTVGIRIHVWPVINQNGIIWDGYINTDIHSVWETRQEATKQLILKANKIYNER